MREKNKNIARGIGFIKDLKVGIWSLGLSTVFLGSIWTTLVFGQEPNPNVCEEYQDDPPIEVVCPSQEPMKQMVLFPYEDSPQELKSLLPEIPQKSKRSMYIGVTVFNDNPGYTTALGGNDAAWTHGYAIALLQKNPKKLNVQATFSSQLYTRRYKPKLGEQGYFFFGIQDGQNYFRLSSGQSQDGHLELFLFNVYNSDDHILLHDYLTNKQISRDAFFENLKTYVFDSPDSGILTHEDFQEKHGIYLPIQFVEENKFELTFTKELAQKALIWHGRGSLSLLNESRVNDILASGSQKAWHKLFHSVAPQYTYLPNEESGIPKISGELESGIEVMQRFKLAPKCNLQLSEALFARLAASRPYTSCLKSKVNASVFIEGKKRTMHANAIFESQLENTGLSFRTGIEFKLTGKNDNAWFTGMMFPSVRYKTNALYNDADGIWTIGTLQSIHKKEKKRPN